MSALDLNTALAVRDQRRKIRPFAQLLLGRVVSASGATVVVTVDDEPTAVPVTIPKLRAYTTPNVNDVVIVAKSGQSLYCLGALNAGAVPLPNPENDGPELPSGGGTSGGDMSPTPPPKRTEETKTLRPVFTGTYRSASWRTDTTDLFQGTYSGTNYGAAYYGSALTALAGGLAISGTVRVQRLPSGTSTSLAPRFRLLVDSERPSGMPGFTEEFTGPLLSVGEIATVDLPIGWLDALLDGQAGGIGIGGDDYMRLAGPSSWAPAMELTITYRK